MLIILIFFLKCYKTCKYKNKSTDYGQQTTDFFELKVENY